MQNSGMRSALQAHGHLDLQVQAMRLRRIRHFLPPVLFMYPLTIIELVLQGKDLRSDICSA